MNKTTKKLTYSAVLIAISVIGAFVKISGSIAFDSMPGFFAAIFLGPVYGALVGFLGHIFTAITSGFPLTVPLHIWIAISMAIACSVFGFVYKKTKIGGIIVGLILNAPFSLFVSSYIAKAMGSEFSGMIMFNTLILILTIAAAANIALASVLYELLKSKLNEL